MKSWNKTTQFGQQYRKQQWNDTVGLKGNNTEPGHKLRRLAWKYKI